MICVLITILDVLELDEELVGALEVVLDVALDVVLVEVLDDVILVSVEILLDELSLETFD